MRHYTVLDIHRGHRLDQFLKRAEEAWSRAFIQKMIKDGHVTVAGKKCLKPAQELKEGQEVVVGVPRLKTTGIVAEAIPLDVVYEDADLVVVNKPAGMVVHPTDHGGHVTGTLVNALMHYCKDLSGIGGEKRPGIVHRLDKDTSGLMVVAKNDDAHKGLCKQFEARTVEKKYVALLKGHLLPKEGSVEAPLLKSAGAAKNVRISAREGSKYALTHYKVTKVVEGATLAEIRIVTGRTHQIRVHFAAIGHPLLGDAMYGDEAWNTEMTEKTGLHRQFLHAASLKFTHPRSKKKMAFEAPLPKDLKDALKHLT